MSDETRIRILVVEDHDVVREGLVAILTRQQMQVVGEACNGEEAVTLYRQHQPDISLMDLRMPKLDGLGAVRAILTESPLARIIIFTNSDGEEQNCLRAGAKAVVLKDAPKGELIGTIRTVHKAFA